MSEPVSERKSESRKIIKANLQVGVRIAKDFLDAMKLDERKDIVQKR